jgi:uncharacterized protein YjiS (DUF1127 family)
MSDTVLHPAIFTARAISRPRFRWLAALARSFERAMIAEDTRRALDQLPDKLLKDIGQTRSEIAFTAGELASGTRVFVRD